MNKVKSRTGMHLIDEHVEGCMRIELNIGSKSTSKIPLMTDFVKRILLSNM
jgi:hypothetical protein